MSETIERRYDGSGARSAAPVPGAWAQPEPYVASAELVEAVNLALFLRRPLLLEGEPGCGKTRLAYAVAYELGYPLRPAYVRSDNKARDLLYGFDGLRRLYDVQEQAARYLGPNPAVKDPTEEPGPADPLDRRKYVTFGSLGQAILDAALDQPSVVLIDEIDKADVDFPNDLLLVLDRLQFSVDEVPGWGFDALRGQTREERRDALPLVIVTSNREKELPPPFLRRCLFYYIEFPGAAELRRIVERHFGADVTPLFDAALDRFWELRQQVAFTWRKRPGTSELLDWVAALERDESVGRLNATRLRSLPMSQLPRLEALVKTKADRDALQRVGAPAPTAGTSSTEGGASA